MLDNRYERVNEITGVSIRLASPTDIRNWSYGEVRKPETINYRTYRSERDGLFCERIFGPEKDWECSCGKYKGIKHKGIVCDRCGVKVTHSRERRVRMGHINLAAPVAHIWFFKAMPSRLGTLLGMKTSHLERVIYFQDYVIIDPGNPEETKLEERQLLSEEQYRELRAKFGNRFEAGMGAEAIKKLLMSMDLSKLAVELRQELQETKSKQRTKDIIKRLKNVEALRDSDNRPEWMILDVVPVIPPDLRPLVLLESGNFASSDLNDLYRRLINRNNRLKKFLDLNAPEVIIRNEKRMLQQSVDALFDNGRCRRPVVGSSNRPLKSLTDMIKGKQGRFRENLLGKRVDYSARSVIVVGPDLKLHQCGVPKKIALELFQPFIIRRLKELGLADTIRSAKKMLERRDEEVWDILEEVIQNHPVILNRAPTLHRMGIMAFEPVLIEGNALRIHPLVCTGFNADFDGDQMAVHLPLSLEAQVEARTLMLSTNNVFAPSNGRPIMAPTQDIVLGCYYLTFEASDADTDKRMTEGGEQILPTFSSSIEVYRAFADEKVKTHERIRVRLPADRVVVDERGTSEAGSRVIQTTVGRILFDDIIPRGMPFYNLPLRKKILSKVITDSHKHLGLEACLKLLDDMKSLGFKAATFAGLSFGKNDMRVPETKSEILAEAQREVEAVEQRREEGSITEKERYNQVIDIWSRAREEVGKDMMQVLKQDTGGRSNYINPIYLMADSGARGSLDQIRQLAGMRGLMAKPSGAIIETPIRANFREGLKVLEYFSSTHGARKGLADTALKTADSGYLTRKLTDVTQNVVVSELDCGTTQGVSKGAVMKGERVEVPLSQLIRGRVSLNTIRDIATDELVISAGDVFDEIAAQKAEDLGYPKVKVRSPLTCESPLGVCVMCYGADLSRGKMVEVGTAVGIIAAQSIGEPGTQLTMRTFHIGGMAARAIQEKEIRIRRPGTVQFKGLRAVDTEGSKAVVLNRNGTVALVDAKGRELEAHDIPLGAVLHVADGAKITPARAKKGVKLCEWDPHTSPLIGDVDGVVQFEDIVEGETMKWEQEGGAASRRMVIMEHKGELHPQILIKNKAGDILTQYYVPEKAMLEVNEGEKVKAGAVLAKRPREVSGTQDITGGLPRVTELFEARTPKDPAVIAEIDGTVELVQKKQRGKRIIVVRNDETGVERTHIIPHGKYLKVHNGDPVKAGDPLVEGPLVPHDILRISGQSILHSYLLNEIQNVYRSQGVYIDDKHIEIVLGQMLRKVRVTEAGDSNFLPGTVVDKHRFKVENQTIIEANGKPAEAEPLLLGITKASLQSESFISAASFQETTKVLTEAAIAGKMDTLVGLKENVILGHLIPAGTGFGSYHKTLIKHSFETSAEPSAEEATEIAAG